jgi:hypothetical protein
VCKRNLSRAKSEGYGKKVLGLEDYEPSVQANKKNVPKSLKDLLANKQSPVNCNNISIITDERPCNNSMASSSMGSPVRRSSIARTVTIKSEGNSSLKNLKSIVPSPKSKRQRQSSKPHIQLDILSADKLMPAKKVF